MNRRRKAHGLARDLKKVSRLGLGLLGGSVAAVMLISVAGPLLIFASWGLSAAGLLILARVPTLRRASISGTFVLATVVLLSLVGAGVTLGRKGAVIAATPTLDPSVVLVSFGIVAAFWAAGVFVLLYEVARGQRLAIIGTVLMSIGLLWFLSEELSRAGVIPRPFIAVSGSGLSGALVIGGIVLIASFARASRRIIRESLLA